MMEAYCIVQLLNYQTMMPLITAIMPDAEQHNASGQFSSVQDQGACSAASSDGLDVVCL